jgi:hypothetical protein
MHKTQKTIKSFSVGKIIENYHEFLLVQRECQRVKETRRKGKINDEAQ